MHELSLLVPSTFVNERLIAQQDIQRRLSMDGITTERKGLTRAAATAAASRLNATEMCVQVA